MAEPILSVENLTVQFRGDRGWVTAVEDVSFAVQPRECLGIVGESGSGKSVTAQTIMRLLPSPPSRIEAGRILFEGRDLAAMKERDLRDLRGNSIGMIFQEPMTSLNPTMTIGRQIAEGLMLHRGMSAAKAKPEVLAMLKTVGIGAAERRFEQYPHQLSGGLRQRVMIAMALACRPKLLIADEPTTALDVTIQAQILALLRKLQGEFGLSILLITHDLGVVAEMCDRVAVMYKGHICEDGPTAQILSRPQHPYTAGLLAAAARISRRSA
jgi:ABC-type dipeptide/oligopeptide/nickel transport system ATPase component